MASTTVLPSLTLDLAAQTVTYAQSYCISAVLCVVMFRAPTGRSHQHHHLLCWLAHSRWPYRSVAFDPSVETFSVAQSGLEPLSLPSLSGARREVPGGKMPLRASANLYKCRADCVVVGR